MSRKKPRAVDTVVSRRETVRAATLYGLSAACAWTASQRGLWGQDAATAAPAIPLGPGKMGLRSPTLDLHFSDDLGMAHWWLPETVLPGKTDGGPGVPSDVIWQSEAKPAAARYSQKSMSYAGTSSDGQLHSAVEVTQVPLGWLASMTITNRTQQVWPDVVCGVCLLLQSSHLFVDPEWKQTYYRTNGTYKTYFGRERDSGQPTFQMSLVKGHRQLARTERHIKKWGFTVEPSDDGVIAVVNRERQVTLVTTWEPTHHLQANCKPTFHCIHANP